VGNTVRSGRQKLSRSFLLVAFGRVKVFRGFGAAACAAVLGIICGFGAGCADAANTATLPLAIHVATGKGDFKRFCAYEIFTPTAAEVKEIGSYWTPLARSAVRVVSRGKMTVTVPKEHLTLPQRRALRLAEWAERAFSPKPRLVCVQIPVRRQGRPRGGGPLGDAREIPGSACHEKGPMAIVRCGPQQIQLAQTDIALAFTVNPISLCRQVILGDEHLHTARRGAPWLSTGTRNFASVPNSRSASSGAPTCAVVLRPKPLPSVATRHRRPVRRRRRAAGTPASAG
jgi:hypothetical protein